MSGFIRKTNRYANFNYNSKNIYFVTFCTYEHKNILADIIPRNENEYPDVIYTELGTVCDGVINKYINEYEVKIPYYVIMPNHVHMIIDFINTENNVYRKGISDVVRGIKSMSKLGLSDRFYEMHGRNIWQRSFYDRIVRNEMEYKELVKYIEENPLKWELDKYYE